MRFDGHWCGPPPTPTAPKFQFSWDHASANHNWKRLSSFQENLQAALDDEGLHSPLTFGSEFRPAPILQPIFQFHTLWPNVEEWLSTGVSFPLRPVSEPARRLDLMKMLERGNHKSALLNPEKLIPTFQDEVSRGWQLLLPLDAATSIPDLVISPVGLAKQETINENGGVEEKFRVTHDQSSTSLQRRNDPSTTECWKMN